MPFIAEAVFQQSETGAFRFVAGWSEARFSDGPLAVVFFYATNLGIPFALALIAAVRPGDCRRAGSSSRGSSRCSSSRTSSSLSAVEFDMNKYFQMMWIAVAILAAWLIRALAAAGHRRGPGSSARSHLRSSPCGT